MSALPRQGWLFLIEFLNGISQNTGKCELGRFSLRQSHMLFIYNLHEQFITCSRQFYIKTV